MGLRREAAGGRGWEGTRKQYVQETKQAQSSKAPDRRSDRNLRKHRGLGVWELWYERHIRTVKDGF